MENFAKNFRNTVPQLLATVSVSIGCIGMGYDEGWASPAIPSLKNDSSFNITDGELNWITSGAPIGATFGSVFAFIFTNRFGRRGAILRISPLYFVSYLLIGLGSNTSFVMAGRIIAGVVNVCTTMAAQIYASEIASPELRGSLSSIPSIFVVLGVFLSYVFGSFLDWRQMTLVELSFPIAYLFMWLQCESPVWLLQNGDSDKARKALQQLRGGNMDITEELSRIKENCDKEADHPKFHVSEIIQPLFYRPVLLCIMMMFFQMFGGYGPIVFNSVSILYASKSPLDENVASIVLAAVMLAVSIVASLLIDSAGRKILLLGSGLLMILSLCALGAFFYIKVNEGESAASSITWLPFAALVLYYASFAGGYLMVPFILLGETFPVRYRDIMSSIGFFANMIFVFAAVRSFPDLKEDIGEHGAYWLYAALLMVSLVFIIVFIPETKGKTLEEIERMFSKGAVVKTPGGATSDIATVDVAKCFDNIVCTSDTEMEMRHKHID